jgi:Mrp family chromosome partitioning ATPase
MSGRPTSLTVAADKALPADHPSNRPLPRYMAIANQKGGVGKTTTAVNLGASLAEIGYRVLVVDLDPQGNATTGLGVNGRNLQASIYDVLLSDFPMEDCVEPTAVKNLSLPPPSTWPGPRSSWSPPSAASCACAGPSRAWTGSSTTCSSTARRRWACSR